ncbi:MAG: aromatic ring-hydroxylating dioxygenase subunit alpha [Kordiimonadaceae bacterium]|nr:aromatic ring-hydroxylating dioxygenase subunit alpha [Kordiimonadaceae bacterium]MBT6036012.1 aromatic ring-hydroxylating dioxygenase subunit alpha [Kordiimonadaceae bacterium]
MLRQSDNDMLTRVGEGTPMGELLRRFWMPALLEEEISEPDCDPVRVRILGEDLVAFKDTDGNIGIVDAYCPHRRAGMFFGRNEECGLRCVYHGWKFDVDGNCVEMPSEPAESDFKHKVKIKSYPAVAKGGAVWIYMGPPDLKPEIPNFEWAGLPEKQLVVTKRLQECNWAQALEGGIDSSHISFLHRNLEDLKPKPENDKNKSSADFAAADRHPVFFIDETDYGHRISARRNAGDDYYWRVTQFLVPFHTLIPPQIKEGRDCVGHSYAGHAWVPIDDENVWTWSFNCNPTREFNEWEENFFHPRTGMWGPIDDDYKPLANKGNEYLIDRKVQTDDNYTGILGIPNQDAAVQESMGLICDRTSERLGTSDKAIIAFRKRLLKMAKDLEAGIEPPEASASEIFNIRSATYLADTDKSIDEGSDWLTKTQ